MDRIDLMKTYLAVADAGSFTAAADKLNMTPQLVSKYIRALEDELKSQLFNRSTRHVSLTETGAAYYERCARLVEDFEDLAADVRQDHREPRGALRITAPTDIAELHLIDALSEFTEKFPHISINLELTDRYLDMLNEGIDVAIRIGTLKDSSLIARRIGATKLTLCASPEYLTKNGTPQTPHDLLNHACIIDTNFKAEANWPFTIADVPQNITVAGKFRVNSASAARKLAIKHQGIALVPSYITTQDVKSGMLTSVLDEFSDTELPIYAMYLETRHLSARIRSFVDFIAPRFKTLN